MARWLWWLMILPLSEVAAFELKRDSEGAPVSWAAAEVVYHLDRAGARDVPPEVLQRVVKASFAEWEGYLDGIRLRYGGLVEGVPVGYDRAPGAVNYNTISFSGDAWSFESQTALAITVTTYRSGGRGMVDADIVFNERAYRFGVAPEGEHDLENTLTHEVGHLLGLGHSDEAEATMYARAAPGETHKRSLHADDVAGAQALYGGTLRPPAELLDGEEALPDTALGGCQAAPGGRELPPLVWLFGLAAWFAWWRRRVLAVLTVFGALLLAQAPLARATVVEGLDLAGLVQRSVVVVEGTVGTTTARWEGGLIVTRAELQVADCLVGACPPGVVIRTLGGELDGLGQQVEGAAQFVVGERALVFLAPRPDGVHSVVGLGQGKFTIAGVGPEALAFRSLEGLQLIGPEAPQAGLLRALSATALRDAVRALAPRARPPAPRAPLAP